MEVQPATLAQVKRLRDGRMIAVDDDVGGVAKDLRAIGRSLRLRYSESAEVFVVYEVHENNDGSVDEHLVTTAQECDQRLVARVRQIADEDYDYAGELDAIQKQKDRDQASHFHDQVGEIGERLAHAIRKDLSLTPSFVHVNRKDSDGQS